MLPSRRDEFMATLSSTTSTVFNQTNVSMREELIRQEFSDRVIIVDEAHHLRSTQDAIEANDASIVKYVQR
jgi:hypothetical protein